MEDPEELARFGAAFEYYFKHFYGPAFPRDLVMHNLLDALRPLYRRAKRLVQVKRQSAGQRSVCLWETCQGLNQVNSHLPSPQRRQLLRLLSNPVLQNLLLAYDEITNYSEELPPPSDMDASIEAELPVKIVNIVKGDGPLGATIKAFPTGEICIARVIAGGAADRCGNIHSGDQILEINNVPVSFKKPEEVLKILNDTTDGAVTFKLVAGKAQTQAHVKIPKAPRRHVRALFDYIGIADDVQPCREAALNFQNGDILEIFTSDDPFWQQARVVAHGSLNSMFISESSDKAESASTNISQDTTKNLPVGIIPTEIVLQHRIELPPFPSPVFYEPVGVMKPGEVRPVLLLGAPCVGRNLLRRQLINSNPEKYVVPVPHTSRPPRQHERNGVDYYFVSRPQMECWIAAGHFVEYGELNNNLYGTMAQTVFQLLRQGKVPVINAHPLSLRILRTAPFKPIIVFVEPPNFSLLKQTRMQTGAMSSICEPNRYLTDRDFAQIISCSAQMATEYGRYTDFRIVNGVLDEAVKELLRVLRDYETLPTWVPDEWLLTTGFKNSCC